MAREKRFTKKEWSWIFYDWANSIYATNIMAAIYPTIFASMFEGGDIRWGYGTSIATFIVAVLAPFLGAVADYKGMKKKLFATFACLGVVFTPLMAAFGNLELCMIGYIVSHIGFSGSCLFYDSFLTDVTTEDRMDKVSAWGYAMGYIGGSTIPFLISIGVLLVMGFDSRFAQVFSVLIVSVWWAAFSIPLLINVKQEHYIEREGGRFARQILKNIWKTFRDICSHKGLLLFIIAYFFYIDGVGTVISISTAYGTTLNLGSVGMILALLVTQIVAVPCSIIFARLSEKFKARRALSGAVIIYIVICLVGFYMGFSMEPSQMAYEKMVQGITDKYEASAQDAEAFTNYANDAAVALRSDDPEAELNELLKESDTADKALYESMNAALLAESAAKPEIVKDFRSAISFSSILFWCMATLVGTVQGGIQAVSRSYFGKLVPKERSNEYFGFFDIFGKFACVIGPALYAFLAEATNRSSYGVLGLLILFICGLSVLVFGRKKLDELAQ